MTDTNAIVHHEITNLPDIDDSCAKTRRQVVKATGNHIDKVYLLIFSNRTPLTGAFIFKKTKSRSNKSFATIQPFGCLRHFESDRASG